MNLDSYFHPLLLLPIFTKVCCELFQHFCFVLPMCRFFKLVPSSLSTNFLLQFLYVQGKKKKKGTAKPPLWLAWLMMCEAWATQSQAEYGAFRPSRSRHITSLQIFCWILLCPICLIFHLLPVFPTIGWVFRVAKEKKRSKEGEFTVDRFQYRVLSIEDSVLHTWSPAKKNLSICAVIAGQSYQITWLRRWHRNQNYLLERFCNICTPKNGRRWRSAGW